MQPAGRSRAAGLGKIPTTSVRRLTSLFNLSSGLVDQIFTRWASGKSANAVISSVASRNIVATTGNWTASMQAMVATWVRTSGPVGWTKIVPIAAATISV